jgi:Mce-associated membrane protein
MEGDAGTRRLNPTGADEAQQVDDTVADIDAIDTAEATPVAAQDEAESSNVPDPSDPSDMADASDVADLPDGPARRQERFGRGWLVGIALALLLAAAGIACGGFLALRGHHTSETIARDDGLALERAKECVAATQAPDVAAMAASQTKILECATGDFAVQANIYSGMLVEVYQIANVSVQVADLRAAVEKHNDDDSVDVLVAVRVKITNTQAADQEQGYRLRVKMAPADGTYKVYRLDQVTS